MKRFSSFVALALVAGLVGLVGSPASAALSTWTVNDDTSGGGQCDTPDYSTIQDAIDAVTTLPGDTIRVCAGTYTEHVTVDKPLTLLGAKAKHDARHDRNKPEKESIVDHPDGGFDITSDSVTIDGFTIQDAQTTTSSRGILALSVSGIQILNNVIQNNRIGVGFSSPGTIQNAFEHNLFRENNGASGGVGIQFCCNPGANNTLIEENLFTGNDSAGMVVIAGSSMGLVITKNESIADGSLAVLFNTTGAEVTKNKGTDFLGSALFFGGGNVGTLVEKNDLSDGDFRGIRFSGSPAATGLTISDNKVKDFTLSGLDAAGSSLVMSGIDHNHFDENGVDGIRLATGNDGNTINDNHMDKNVEHDAHDDTTGVGTAGTANTWTKNHCKTENVSGLCK